MLAALAPGAAGVALASETFLSRDRPTRTRSTVAVFPRVLVVEAGASLSREGPLERASAGELALRYGVFESVELRVELGSWWRVDDGSRAESGRSDPELSAKLELRDYSSGWIPESALVAGARVPLGDPEVGGERDGGYALLALAWELGPASSITTNAGLARGEAPRGRFTQAIASVELSWSATRATTLYGELFALSEDASDESASLRVGLGASRLLRDGLALDLRVERGSSGEDPDYLVGAGLSVRF